MSEVPGWANARPRGAARALPPAAIGTAIVLAFVLVYPIRGFRVPLGSDTPVYVWWARFAGSAGLGRFGTGGRPAVVGSIATLSHVTGRPGSAVVAALTPALGAALALALAALTACALGRSARRFALVAVLVGTFLSFMVSGYDSTVAFGAFLVAGLALLAEAFAVRSLRSTVGAAALVGAAGLAHPLLLPLAAALLAGAAVALVPSWARDRRAGVAAGRTALGRLVIASGGGAVAIGAGLLASGVGSGPTMNTSRDSILRRTGLSGTLRASYLRKLRHDFPWWRTVPFAVLALTALLPEAELVGRPDPSVDAGPADQDRRRLFVGVIVAWVVATAVGVVALRAGTTLPGQRLADLCLPVPVLAAIGLDGLWRRRGRFAMLAAAGATASVVLAILPWWSSTPLITTAQVEQAREVGALLAARPPGTPLIVVMDDRSDKPGLFVTRDLNLVRDEVPAARAGDVHVFVGTPADLVAGRPALTGQAEHDRLARGAWDDVRPLLGRGPLVVLVRSFDPAGYAALQAAPDARIRPVPWGPGRAPPPVTEPVPATSARALNEPGAGPLSPWLPLWLGPVLFALLAALGWPWTRLALPGSSAGAVMALSPAVGGAALALASVAADAAGLRLTGPGGWMAAAAAAAGWIPFVLERRRDRVRASASAPTQGSP